MALNFAEIQGSDWMDQLNENFKTLSTADLIELASDAETVTGTDATKGVSPHGFAAGVAAALAASVKRGVHSVTSGEASAYTLTIATGLAAATGFIVQVWRSGVDVHADAVVSLTSGSLTVANGSTFTLTASDKVTWIVF